MSENQQLTPEEIQKRIQLAKDNCIFCKIISKEIPGKIIFEDDLSLAILDINPATTGHILLMPKEHYMMMPLVPDQVLGHLGVISKYLSDLLKSALGAYDVSIHIANGAAAGQQSQHFMMHVIPRYEDDNLDFSVKGEPQSQEQLEFLANKLKAQLEKMNNSQNT